MAVTSQRTHSQAEGSLSGPGFPLQLGMAGRQEVQAVGTQPGRRVPLSLHPHERQIFFLSAKAVMPFHVQNAVAVPSCCGSPGLVADTEVFSCSPQPRFVGMSEPMFQRMVVICSFLLHAWGRICQPLVTPTIMLRSHSVTKGQISLRSLTGTRRGK